jgi:ABC1 atypical kinase-like domain
MFYVLCSSVQCAFRRKVPSLTYTLQVFHSVSMLLMLAGKYGYCQSQAASPVMKQNIFGMNVTYKVQSFKKKKKLFCFQVNHKLIECFSYQLFHTGFVHADPHPGNSKFGI